MSYKKLTAAICAVLIGCSFSAEAATPASTDNAQVAKDAQQQTATNPNIRSVTSIATVFGDGEKVDAVALEYPNKIDAATVTPDKFRVEGQEIVSAYTNDKPAQSEELVTTAKPGKYVILKLKYVNEQEQQLIKQQQKQPQGQMDKGPGGGDAPHMSDRAMPDLSVKVEQTGLIRGEDGHFYAPSTAVATTTRTTENDLAGFKQYTYTDPETDYTIPYNLFLPNGYTPDKKYPLMLFITDASGNSNNVKMALVQGNGAVVWAKPEEQAKHPCIVLAPEYTNDLISQIGMMTTDSNVWTPGLTLVTHLLQNIINTYSVDTNRIYGTGQSQGGMANIAISDKYPDLFAAQYLVACQWNTKEMEVLKDKNLWIVVSEGDMKAYPGMNDATARWEKLGTKVARDKMWNPKSAPQEFDQLVGHMAGQGAHINYTVLQGGNHNYTWTVAYSIEGIRDWIFLQSKDNSPVIPNHKEITGYDRQVVASEMLAKGKLYYEGENKNYDYAMQYFREADRLGQFKAARYIGLLYEKGLGVRKNNKEAVQWYKKAMEAGDITATCYLGHMYEDGLGVKQDYVKALQYYAKSAERGDIIAAPGMVAEAKLYEKGLGVAKDTDKAEALYAQAKATGYEFKR